MLECFTNTLKITDGNIEFAILYINVQQVNSHNSSRENNLGLLSYNKGKM